MGVTNNQKLMLYSLGQCYRQLNKRFENKPLEVSVSKIAFIEMLMKSKLVGKKERAMYKNLEILEKMKLISYESKQLSFTQRGYKFFNRIVKDVQPFVNHNSFWNSNIKLNRKLQAVLKNK